MRALVGTPLSRKKHEGQSSHKGFTGSSSRASSWLAYGNSDAAHGDATFFQVRAARCGPQRESLVPDTSSQHKRREFCFTLENDVFVRYQSFKDGKALRAALTKCAHPVLAQPS